MSLSQDGDNCLSSCDAHRGTQIGTEGTGGPGWEGAPGDHGRNAQRLEICLTVPRARPSCPLGWPGLWLCLGVPLRLNGLACHHMRDPGGLGRRWQIREQELCARKLGGRPCGKLWR